MNKVPNPPLPLHLRNAQTKRKFMQNTQPGRYQFIKYIPTFIRLLRGDGGGSGGSVTTTNKLRRKIAAVQNGHFIFMSISQAIQCEQRVSIVAN